MFSKKNKKTDRNPRIDKRRQQSYHYSSRRSIDDRALNRRRVFVEGDETQKKPKKANLVSYIPSIIAVGIILVSVYYLFTLSTSPNIVVVNETEKTKLIDKNSIKQKAKTVLEKSYSNRFKPTFNEDKLEKELLGISKEIVSVEIETSFLRHNPEIRVEISEPSVVLSTGSNLYVVGADGIVLADITKSREGIKVDGLPLVQDQSSIDINLGKKALTQAQVDYLEEIVFQGTQKGLNISSMTIRSAGSQLDVKYANLSYYVKYNFFEDARRSSGVYIAIKERLDAEGSVPLEYVDVRVPERAYVK